MPSRASEPVEDSDAPIVSVPVGALLVVTSPLEPQPATVSASATMTTIFSLICAPITLINLVMSISMRLVVDGPLGEILPDGRALVFFLKRSPLPRSQLSSTTRLYGQGSHLSAVPARTV